MPALKERLEKAVSLGHLPTLQGMLQDLEMFTNTNSHKVSISEISQHISLDPSLSVRLLRMANSAYYAREEPVLNMEDAVWSLGVAQIRMVAMTTRCVEALCPADQEGFLWTDFWRHCIATAHFSRLLGGCFYYADYDPELAYMSGLMHDVGKLVIAMLSPDAFRQVVSRAVEENLSFEEAEQRYLDTDHSALGGWYLERQNMPPGVYEGVRCHHKWGLAVKNQELPAIVNVADFLAREHHLGCSGNMAPTTRPFSELPSWEFLTSHLEMKEDMAATRRRVEQELGLLATVVDSVLPRTKEAALPSAGEDPGEDLFTRLLSTISKNKTLFLLSYGRPTLNVSEINQAITMDSNPAMNRLSRSEKETILLVDDEQPILDFLDKMLEPLGCQIVLATNLAQARQAIFQHENLGVILCDQRLTDGSGLDFFRELKSAKPNIVRILVTGYVEMQVALAAINEGEIFRFLTKPILREELETVVKQALERFRLVRENQKLQGALVAGNEQLQQANVSLQKALSQSVKLCLEILDRFDHALAGHSARVAKWAVAIGHSLSLSSKEIEILEIAAQLHDIGLISVPRRIHRHQQMGWDDLPAPQQTALHAHPKQGAELVQFLPQKEVAEIIMAHHEWFNGQGYPLGIADKRIPFLASIIAVPDAYDEIPMERAEAEVFMKENLGIRFHPEVGQTFFNLLSEQPGYAKAEREMMVTELQDGMKLTANLYSSSGVLLIPTGQVLTPKLIQYIQQHNQAEPLPQRIFVES